MKVVILAGGYGTRLAEETMLLPKPMVEIGGRPLLWHIMKHFSWYGHSEFVLALGYKGEVIKRYFLEYPRVEHDLTIMTGTGEVEAHGRGAEDWVVHLVDTGLDTMTGGRLRRLRRWVCDEPFMLTYGDGVSDVDLEGLVKFHVMNNRLATVTTVRPPARFGDIQFGGDEVLEFAEKQQAGEGWINGGFFLLEPAVLDFIEGDGSSFERDVLPRLAKQRQLVGYRHEGFWQCMDTLREKRFLEGLWTSGNAPWAAWA